MQTIRQFLANRKLRRRISLFIALVGLIVVGAGAIMALPAHLEYQDLSDDLDDVNARVVDLQAALSASADGDEEPSDEAALPEATADIFTLQLEAEQEQWRIKNDRIDAENDRYQGVRIIGYGVVVLAFAYLVLPEGKDEDREEEEPEDESPAL